MSLIHVRDLSIILNEHSNFNSIVAAISEGRRLFTNIQRFIVHLLTTNVAEVVLLIVGLCFLDETNASVFPMSPIGVLWVNMVSHMLDQKHLHCSNYYLKTAYEFAACLRSRSRESLFGLDEKAASFYQNWCFLLAHYYRLSGLWHCHGWHRACSCRTSVITVPDLLLKL